MATRMATLKRGWKLVPKAVMLKPGDVVRHYEELMGAPGGKRQVHGWSEVGVVVQVIDKSKEIPGWQDCLIAFVGTKDKDFHPKDFDGARPYILRYYNSSLVKL